MATTAAPSAGGQTAASKELRREVGLVGLAWASMGSIIGSGWLLASNNALIVSGPSAIFSWLIGAVAIIILALIHAELGAMYPVSGGTARFPHFVFGAVAGASYGWFSWLQAVTVAPVEVIATISYMTHFSWADGFLNANGTLSASGFAVAVGLMAVFVLVNLLSVRGLAHTNSALTWWKIAIPVLTIIVLMVTTFHTSNFTASSGFAPAGTKGVFSALATGGVIFALLGFEQADQLAGESRRPKRDIPLGIVGTIIIGALIYFLLQVAYIGSLPGHLIPGDWTNSSSHLAGLTGPFATVATLASLGWLANLLYVDAVVSPGGTGLIYTTATSRISYGLSRNGYFPQFFQSLTSRRVPWVGVVVSFVAGIILFLPFPSWQRLIELIVSVSVLMYGGAPLALGALRKHLPEAPRPYRVPFAAVLAPLGFVIANLLVMWSTWDTYWKLAVAIGIGYVVLGATRTFSSHDVRARWNFSNSLWIPVYLIGIGVITFLSSFGAYDDPPLPFGWDALVAAVFSLVIYHWAVASALPPEEIRQMVETYVLPEDSELAEA
jgi:amino acid transporter